MNSAYTATADIESFQDYFERLRDRVGETASPAQKLSRIWFTAMTAENHFRRFEEPLLRYLRARELNDFVSASYERRVMLALLYEIADTAFICMGLLDFDKLDLESSADGFGLSGESAPMVIKILKELDRYCSRVMELEEHYELRVDFSDPVDEKEGITYSTHRHWQDFVSGSIKDSFDAYFQKAHQVISVRLNQRPHFWKKQAVRQYLYEKGYGSLLTIMHRLEEVYFDIQVSPDDVRVFLRHGEPRRKKGEEKTA